MQKPDLLTRTVRNPTVLTAAIVTALALMMTGTAGPAACAAIVPGLSRIEGGVKGGIGLTQHQGVEDPRIPYSVDSEWRRGVAASAFLRFPVTDRFSLQQEIGYFQKGSRQGISLQILEVPTELDVVYDLDYLEVPLLMRFLWWRGLPFGRQLDLYSLNGFAFSLKLDSRYRLSGELVDDDAGETISLSADASMDEVDLFDFAFVYGTGLEFPTAFGHMLLEYRFSLSIERLSLPTYACVPAWDGSEILIENDPVPLRNQAHAIMVGIRF